MTTAVILHDTYLTTLYEADLLCYVCCTKPWTQQALYCTALICAECAQGEPSPANMA